MDDRPKRRGDRKDGYYLKDLDPIHKFMPYMMPHRADTEAFISESIDLGNIIRFLAEKNTANLDTMKYTIFHVVAAAIAKTVYLRPKMNRFISGHRYYQRKELSLAFVAKKEFSDDGEEGFIFIKCNENSTIHTIRQNIYDDVHKVRKGQAGETDNALAILAKLPRFLLRIIMGILKLLDYYGRVPHTIIAEDPDYASIFLTNLGSIQLNSGYHHLNNWGTNSLFVVIGEKHFSPVFQEDGSMEMRPKLDIGITVDERIADGYYYAKTIRLLKYLLQNPHLLELPAKEEVAYES